MLPYKNANERAWEAFIDLIHDHGTTSKATKGLSELKPSLHNFNKIYKEPERFSFDECDSAALKEVCVQTHSPS